LTGSTDDGGSAATGGVPQLSKALPSLWRTFRLGARVEPRLLAATVLATGLMLLPDVVLALWLKLLTDGVLSGNTSQTALAATALAVSATLTWYLGVVSDRVSRRFRDRISMAMEAHIARLQAGVPTIAHQEHPEYLDRLSMLREQSFSLDHLFSSMVTNIGLVVRLAVTAALLGSVHPALMLLVAAGLPALLVSLWRPAVERAVLARVEAHRRRFRHLFVLATDAGPAKEVRTLAIGADIRRRHRQEWRQWFEPISTSRWASTWWSAAAWACFALAYAGGIAWAAASLPNRVGDVVLVVVAGQRLSMYIAQTAAELGFLRGVWLEASLH
jgi:ATP-binding cassette, subfamily B, bacterial